MSSTDTSTDWHPRDNPERLRHLYHDEGLNQREIGQRVGLSQQAVGWWMRRHGVATRQASRPNPPYDTALRDPDYLRAAYWGREQTLSEIAAVFDVAPGTVAHWMRRHDIPRREAGGTELQVRLTAEAES